ALFQLHVAGHLIPNIHDILSDIACGSLKEVREIIGRDVSYTYLYHRLDLI
ncbi:hypothetical protein ACJX0J_012459, partial [Zea mays]